MMQGKKFLLNGMAALAVCFVAVGCSNDYLYTEQDALNNANSVLGIEIPSNQNWKMTQEVTANVTVNLDNDDEYTVVVYDKNPFSNSDAVYFTKKKVTDASITKLDLSVPSSLTELYVSVVDSKKHSRSRPVSINGDVVDIIFGTPMEGSYTARTRANNTGETYPSTHQYYDADGNLIAAANMNHNEWADPNKEFGGWVVPDTLTTGQKLRVQMYFQANPNLSYEDPHLRHFFVQQVYTGGTSAPETGNKEATAAADGQTHQGMTLNQLTVGEACSHINDFNAGTCSPSSVLDNGSTVNNGTYHNDQITLMVNVWDTSCFGYHETSGSNVQASTNHNDKMALVSAAVIDEWAAANGNPGEAVVDKWNRSFMGFDYELLPECDIVQDSYAELNAVPNINNILYAWDGEKVMTIGPAPEVPQATPREEVDITATFAKENMVDVQNVDWAYDENGYIVCTFNNQYYNSITFKQPGDWTEYDKLVIEFAEPSPIALTLSCEGSAQISVGATQVEVATVNWAYNGNGGPNIAGGTGLTEPVTLTIKKVTLVKEGTTPVVDNSIVYYNPTYLLGDADNQKIAFYSNNTNMYGGIVRTVTEDEMKTTQNGVTCLDLTFFQGLVADGYHPITTDLKTWAKWEAACDGYYSDWIVTLTEANRIEETHDEDPGTPSAIYSYAFEDSWMADYDMNDVVLKVKENENNSDYLDVTICCTGASYNLKVWHTFKDADGNTVNEKIFGGQEVHSAMGGNPGMFINTGSGDDTKFQTITDLVTVQVKKPADFKGIADFWIESPERDVHVSTEKDPHGVLIPYDWRWPKEWVCIKLAYPDFINFALHPEDPAYAEWYKNPAQENTEDLLY